MFQEAGERVYRFRAELIVRRCQGGKVGQNGGEGVEGGGIGENRDEDWLALDVGPDEWRQCRAKLSPGRAEGVTITVNSVRFGFVSFTGTFVVSSEHTRRNGHTNNLSAPLYQQTDLTPPMKVSYGSHTRLLHNLFGIDEGLFEIMRHYHISQTSRYENDIVALFTVELDEHPVLSIEQHFFTQRK